MMEIKILDPRSGKQIATLDGFTPSSTITDVKKAYFKKKPQFYPGRQAFRTEPRGKLLKDSDTLSGIGINQSGALYFKDLGPQVGWTTVFLTEYAGPLVIYLAFYVRPAFIYGEDASSQPIAKAVHVAAGCWTFHYAKRLLETVFVHRFSHGTMPLTNIFKNSSYYWGFAAFVAYFVNHPLYTPPMYGDTQLYAGLAAFVFAELGNFSIHVALRNLRPAGSKERKIPYAGSNPFTWLFKFVSCPNYTYEVMAWTSFSILSQTLPVALFALAGFVQMSIWAIGKHKNYRKEFSKYPRGRKSIIPFLL